MWRLEDAQGQLIDELAEPMEFLLGGDDLLAKVEETLIGQTINEACQGNWLDLEDFSEFSLRQSRLTGETRHQRPLCTRGTNRAGAHVDIGSHQTRNVVHMLERLKPWVVADVRNSLIIHKLIISMLMNNATSD